MNIIDEILESITPEEMAQTVRSMGIASLIADAIEVKSWSHHEFAQKIGKKTTEIPTLLRGHYNFTVDELTTIELALNTKLFFVDALDWTPDVAKHHYQLEETPEYSVAAEP